MLSPKRMPIDAQFAHARTQGMRIDAEHRRGTERTFDTSMAALQCGFDVMTHRGVEVFEFAMRGLGLRRCGRTRSDFTAAERFGDFESPAVTENRCAFDHRGQFAHIARPPIGGEPSILGIGDLAGEPEALGGAQCEMRGDGGNIFRALA